MDQTFKSNQPKKPSVFVLLIIPTIIIIPFLFHHFSPPDGLSTDTHIFDIDIGTNGQIMNSTATTVITFDPSDKLMITPKLESYPFGIADFNGNATFYYNKGMPACSSLNIRNEYYNTTIRDERIAQRCQRRKFEGRPYRCQHHPDVEIMIVPVRSLSSFLKERGVNKVNKLKIDTQGSDFSIIKDFFENIPNVELNFLMFECQYYDQAMPLYFASNDCSHILKYLKGRFPKLKYRKQMNSCMAAEYNIKINFTTF